MCVCACARVVDRSVMSGLHGHSVILQFMQTFIEKDNLCKVHPSKSRGAPKLPAVVKRVRASLSSRAISY